MRLLPSDPDIETVVSRIKSGDIDLQPEFQRGEVWSRTKQQRLIDSILRDWHVPPIHVIENPKSNKQEVLDGQQRLAAIRDFVQNKFPVDGRTEPVNSAIEALDGKRYRELPKEWRRRFNQFTLRIFRIVDYEPSEPAELFFRLNQPANLTGAEQRNAFFGPVRDQIKSLSDSLETAGLKRLLAFSNLRMAYDDVLSRVAVAVERGTLAEKITSADLTELYRRETQLSSTTTDLIAKAISELARSKEFPDGPSPKFNKATLFSWLIFLVRGFLSENFESPGPSLAEFLRFFTTTMSISILDPEYSQRLIGNLAPANRLFSIYEIRSSARVADVSSVILRDAVIWLAFYDFNTGSKGRITIKPKGLDKLRDAFLLPQAIFEDDLLARRLIDNGWGKLA